METIECEELDLNNDTENKSGKKIENGTNVMLKLRFLTTYSKKAQ